MWFSSGGDGLGTYKYCGAIILGGGIWERRPLGRRFWKTMLEQVVLLMQIWWYKAMDEEHSEINVKWEI